MTQQVMEYLYSLALMVVDEANDPDSSFLSFLQDNPDCKAARLYAALGLCYEEYREPNDDDVKELFRTICHHHNLTFPHFFNKPADFKEYALCQILH